MNAVSIIALAVGLLMCGIGIAAIQLALHVVLDEAMLGEEIRPARLDPDELGDVHVEGKW